MLFAPLLPRRALLHDRRERVKLRQRDAGCPPRLCWSTKRRLGGAAYHLVSSATTGRGSQPTASPASPRPNPNCCPPSTPIPEASLNPSRRAVQRFPSPSLLTPSAPSSLDPLQSQNGYGGPKSHHLEPGLVLPYFSGCAAGNPTEKSPGQDFAPDDPLVPLAAVRLTGPSSAL